MSVKKPSKSTGEEQEAEPRQFLYFAKDFERGFVPYLPAYYSYLLRLSKNVSLVDIYPWLAELMFHSVAINGNNLKKGTPKDVAPINVISFFIDDQKDNIANSMHGSWSNNFSTSSSMGDPFCDCCRLFGRENAAKKDPLAGNRPRNIIVDTYGDFGDMANNDYLENSVLYDGIPIYMPTSLVGPGNPMRMIQRFSDILELPELPGKNGKNGRLGDLNVFLINSVSTLNRTLGFRDSMLFVRGVLERSVWKPDETKRVWEFPREQSTEHEKATGSLLGDKPGMLFAILEEEVFSKGEISYAETFFDGVFSFREDKSDTSRNIHVGIDRLPLVPADMLENLQKEAGNVSRLQPDYSMEFKYTPLGNIRVKGKQFSRDRNKGSDGDVGSSKTDGKKGR